ncbi:hypothetical protein R1flu_000121 [Riccia fluitans]|uniref:Uncharacterized protein n=1 Tax=Riccia fluitans TaxID=41844 RepID=A0ABD1XZJ3_9MARC
MLPDSRLSFRNPPAHQLLAVEEVIPQEKVFLTSRNGTNDLLKVNLYLHLVWTGATSELLGCKGGRIRN